MRKTIASTTIAIAMLCSHIALGQSEFKYRFRPSPPPTTNALAPKGRLRVEYGLQGYFKTDSKLVLENIPIVGEVSIPLSLPYLLFADAIASHLLNGNASSIVNLHLHTDAHWGVYYTPWDNITLGASYSSSFVLDSRERTRHYSAIMDNLSTLFELSGGYHRIMGKYWGVECSTALGLGRGEYTHKHTAYNAQDTLQQYDAQRYSLFNHSLGGGVSVFTNRKRVQLMLMMTTGYTRYLNAKIKNVKHEERVQGYERMDGQGVLPNGTIYVDPSLMLSLNARRVFSFQLQAGLSMGKGEGSPQPHAGFAMSFRILGPGNFERDRNNS